MQFQLPSALLYWGFKKLLLLLIAWKTLGLKPSYVQDDIKTLLSSQHTQFDNNVLMTVNNKTQYEQSFNIYIQSLN